MRPTWALLAVLLLAGCHVPDQTDVPIALGGAPPFRKPAPVQPAPTPSGPRPLVTIHPTPGVSPTLGESPAPGVSPTAGVSPTPGEASRLSESYDSALRLAVTAARARKPDVAFDVVNVVPATGTADAQVSAAIAGSDLAAAVARSIVSLGVPPSRVTLSASTDPQAKDQEIRVFVH